MNRRYLLFYQRFSTDLCQFPQLPQKRKTKMTTIRKQRRLSVLTKGLSQKSGLFSKLIVKCLDENQQIPSEIKKIALYAVDDIGVLFRPCLFCMGVGLNSDKIESDYYDVAVAIELMQISTLVIDDIFDDSPTRNEKKTMPKQYGIKNTIILGELFRSLANEIILNSQCLNNTEKQIILAYLEEANQKICIGQFWDLQYEKKDSITESEYFEMVAHTTGYFVQKSLLSGVVIAGISEKKHKALAEYGLKLGMAYQLRDDLVNIFANGSNGKKVAEDLIAHKKRLPVICVMRDPNHGERFRKVWNKPIFSNSDIEKLLQIIEESSAIECCRSYLVKLCEEAIACVTPFDFGKKTEELIDLANLVCSV